MTKLLGAALSQLVSWRWLAVLGAALALGLVVWSLWKGRLDAERAAGVETERIDHQTQAIEEIRRVDDARREVGEQDAQAHYDCVFRPGRCQYPFSVRDVGAD